MPAGVAVFGVDHGGQPHHRFLVGIEHRLVQARVLDGQGGGIGDRHGGIEVRLFEGRAVALVQHFENAEYFFVDDERRTEQRPGTEAGGIVDYLVEVLTAFDIVNDERFTGPRHLAGDAVLRAQPYLLQGLADRTGRGFEEKFMIVVAEETDGSRRDFQRLLRHPDDLFQGMRHPRYGLCAPAAFKNLLETEAVFPFYPPGQSL